MGYTLYTAVGNSRAWVGYRLMQNGSRGVVWNTLMYHSSRGLVDILSFAVRKFWRHDKIILL
jgi:hypothetical protein